uniref:RanBP-type and C3HC4-type zinc finger-containing protein 1 n=2 Tax=Culex pipiens TaxID=7175 RepID=A0A8D8DMF6_CULPI
MENEPGSSNKSLRQAMEAPLARNRMLASCLGCGEPQKMANVFCDVCLIRTIKSTIHNVQVHCPQSQGDQRCSTLLQEREIRSLLSCEDFARYERKCLEFAEGGNDSSIHCFTENCKGWIVVDGFVDSFVCSAVYPGKSCKQYKLENCIYDRDELSADEFAQFLKDSLNLHDEKEVRCPMILDDDQRCAYVIQEREIRSVLKPEDYAKYEQRCLEVAEGSFTTSVHCVTPNCKGWVILDPNRNVTSFTCEVCSTENCVSCKAIHQGKSCAEHLAELQKNVDEKLGEEAIKEMLGNRQAMLCPGCKRLITKNGGCDFIRCIKCKFEICWPTRGPRWGPGGEGDESGGCVCTLQKRCHPECEGCHVFIK